MLWATGPSFAAGLGVPNMTPQSISRCFGCSLPKVSKKQSPKPCRYMRIRARQVEGVFDLALGLEALPDAACLCFGFFFASFLAGIVMASVAGMKECEGFISGIVIDI